METGIMAVPNNGTQNSAAQGGGNVNLFAFTNIDRAWGFCVKLADSKIIPDAFKGNAASCLIALDMANRMRRSPMEVMHAMYVVHGKPGFSSSFLIGLINSCGLFERLRFEYVGTEGKSDWGCRAWTIEKATGEKLVGPLVTMGMAEEEGWTANKKWRTMPEMMLSYRAASFFSRRYCPDLAGGMHSAEELSDSDMRDSREAATGASRGTGQGNVTMEQIMNAQAPVDDKKGQAATPVTEANPPQPQNAAVTPEVVEAPTLPFEPRTHGLVSIELTRREIMKEMEFLGLTEPEREEFFKKHGGAPSLQAMTEAGLSKVQRAIEAELAKRDEEGR